jgi:ribosomal protein L7/L12
MTTSHEIAGMCLKVGQMSQSDRSHLLLRLLIEFPDDITEKLSQLSLVNIIAGVDRDYRVSVPGGETFYINEVAKTKIDSFLGYGQKVEAIKEFRSATGTGLKESKDAIDSWHAGIVAKNIY